MLTQQQLKEYLHYNPDTGVFTRLFSKTSKIKIGDVVGYKTKKGYGFVNLNGKNYFSHRLAWLYVYGYTPKHQIDHINGIKDDNRICNLREATNAENHQNFTKPMAHNTSGVLGVHFHKKRKKWCVTITTNGKLKHIGYFLDKDLAAQAYIEAKRQLHPFSTI